MEGEGKENEKRIASKADSCAPVPLVSRTFTVPLCVCVCVPPHELEH